MMEQFGGDLRGLWDQVRWISHDSGLETPTGHIHIVGLPGAGKKTLFNTLWGRETLRPEPLPMGGADFGLFKLVDLPCDLNESEMMFYPPFEEAGLFIYVLNGTRGLSTEDFQWISRLRVSRTPMLVVLNLTIEMNSDSVKMTHEIEEQLSLRILPIRATDIGEVRGLLIEAILHTAPELSSPLAGQIASLRSAAAQRVVRQAAVLSMAISVEPIPLIDLTVLLGVQIHMLNRVASFYGHRLNGHGNWEVVLTLTAGLLLRYFAQTLLKFIPWGGWIVSGVIGASATWMIGQAAVLYYEEAYKNLPQPRQILAYFGERLNACAHKNLDL